MARQISRLPFASPLGLNLGSLTFRRGARRAAPCTLKVSSPYKLDRERTLSRHLKVQTRVIPINHVVEPLRIVPLFGDQPSQRWNVLRVAGNPISLARIAMPKFPDPVSHNGYWPKLRDRRQRPVRLR